MVWKISFEEFFSDWLIDSFIHSYHSSIFPRKMHLKNPNNNLFDCIIFQNVFHFLSLSSLERLTPVISIYRNIIPDIWTIIQYWNFIQLPNTPRSRIYQENDDVTIRLCRKCQKRGNFSPFSLEIWKSRRKRFGSRRRQRCIIS